MNILHITGISFITAFITMPFVIKYSSDAMENAKKYKLTFAYFTGAAVFTLGQLIGLVLLVLVRKLYGY